MIYSIIQPPFLTLKFRTMSRAEANRHFIWFLEQIPIRISILEHAVKSIASYESWKADYTPESLEDLGQWFYENIETRSRSEAEKEEIYNNAPEWFRKVEVQDWQLSNRTFSLVMDIGMYLSQVFEKNLSGLKWVMVEKPKNDAYYQQPVLKGTGQLVFNPVEIMLTLAYGFARKNRLPEELREVYDIWSEILKK